MRFGDWSDDGRSGKWRDAGVRFDQDDQSQIEVNSRIRIAAQRICPVDLPYVPILLNETFKKPLWDTEVVYF
ncbi:uncharacterized protein TNCV_2697951 [Trichonephila clavipes]|nr:uncharacterized protein TNCV_2697951 [Trichonephila clavipes]